MKIGFAKTDITPRVGVELCGFGPFLNRHSIAVRDRLWARAMAIGNGKETETLILVSCDLVGLDGSTVTRIRELVGSATGIAPDRIMVHWIHTHSGPNTCTLIGWGDMDFPYMELLPGRIADACCRAVKGMVEGALSHAAVPCEGMGLNREYDRDAPPLEEVLRDDWRPARPELTDTVCHVIRANALDGRLIGFCSYFGCHPVVCCQETRYIHGDYAGVATNLLERENPGSVGLFLQGAQGDVNSCVVHKPEPESLLALDVIAARFANSVRKGLNDATPLKDQGLSCVRREVVFSRIMFSREELQKILAEKEAILHAPGATDTSPEFRMATVYAVSIRRMLAQIEAGETLVPPTEVQGFRIGELTLLGSPFEIFQAIKNDVVKAAHSPIPLVMGLTNDLLGYAPDQSTAARGGYAAQMVPIMLGRLPFADIHRELVENLVKMDLALNAK